MERQLNICDLGRLPYSDAEALQEILFEKRCAGNLPDTLLILEHDHVLTLGRSADQTNILEPLDQLRDQGVAVENTGRGGDVTYHGPGQLVGYPVLSLKDAGIGVTDYVSALEDIIIAVLGHYGLNARTDARNRGVWIGNSKIAAIGLRIRRHVSIHGFALNVTTDLRMYDKIVPCGISDAGVTSMAGEGVDADMGDLKTRITGAFTEILNYDVVSHVRRKDIEKA